MPLERAVQHQPVGLILKWENIMSNPVCPGCGWQFTAAAASCPQCGRAQDAANPSDQSSSHPNTGAANLEQVNGFPTFEYTPEFMEWARQQYSEEEILAGIREIEETGGLELKDFIHELEQIVDSND
jgi:hypothetical protein